MSHLHEAEEAANTFRANYVPNAGLVSVDVDYEGAYGSRDNWYVRVGIDATCRVVIPDFVDGVPVRTYWHTNPGRPFLTS